MTGTNDRKPSDPGRGRPRKGETLATSADFGKELRQMRDDMREAFDASWWRRMVSAPVDCEKLPIAMKVFGVL